MSEHKNKTGLLLSMTNETKNKIVSFARGCDGKLTMQKSYSTNGTGTGAAQIDPLSSQGSLIISKDGSFAFAVNAGSDSISCFSIRCDELVLTDVAYSGGVMPNSLAYEDNILYVTNVGDKKSPCNISGFHVHTDGCLHAIPFSTKLLSSAAAQPDCITFDKCRRKLVVSEKATNLIDVFNLNCKNTAIDFTVNKSSGADPFGSVLSAGLLLVSEAGPNALSSYKLMPDGCLKPISRSVCNGQQATCWVSTTPDMRYAYTSNSGSGTITLYSINKKAELKVLDSIPSIPCSTGGPIDSAIDSSGKYFYVLNGNKGSISVFSIMPNGHLEPLEVFQRTGLPAVGAQGLAVL